ncbi:MAG: hypothetical protein JST00_14310 [Deltaproteobacteria bacterium]|nr:hypothetical protein [Deltaproteobacteria bacterium]
MKHSLLLSLAAVAALTLRPSPARADDTPPEAQEGSGAPVRRVGVELDVVQPFVPTVGILKPKVTVMLWGNPKGLRGDLVAGLFIRPHVEHDVLEHIDEYMLVAGYRQYWWHGVHTEVLLDGGAAWGRNKFDGKEYRTPTLFLEANVGYRFAFFEKGGLTEGSAPIGFFVTPQFGALGTLGVSDIGPRNGKPDWFVQGNLLVGASF